MFKVKMNCIQCEKEMSIGAPELKRVQASTVDGEHLWLMYFDCTHCGTRNFVQVDNDKTQKLLKDEAKLMLTVIKMKRHGKSCSKRLSEKRKRISDDLAKTRKKLAEYVSGQVVINDEDNQTYIVYFNDIE